LLYVEKAGTQEEHFNLPRRFYGVLHSNEQAEQQREGGFCAGAFFTCLIYIFIGMHKGFSAAGMMI
jgi:hypothetical protein